MSCFAGAERRRQERARLATELRQLGDRIERGDLPESGAVVQVGRRAERVLKAQRPAVRPGARAKQARWLAHALTERVGAEVVLSYDPRKDWRGEVGSYVVEWSNGPTYAQMKELVAQVASGRVSALDLDKLRYVRTCGSNPQIASLLRHLDAHPEDGRTYGTAHTSSLGGRYNRLDSLAHEAASQTAYPERIDEQTSRRIDAIRRLDPHGRISGYEPTAEAWLSLGDHLVQHGWPATREWLDQVVAASEAPGVVQPADRRQARGAV